ncbi:MAG: YfhO family protein [Butyricicoccus sp.]
MSKQHPLLRTALLCILVGALCLLPCLIGSDGQLVYYGDYFRQYVPFLKETRRMLLSGSYAWSWNTFLGDGFYSSYSYYTVCNPFAYIALLFPDSLLLYGTLVAQLAKFAVSGIGCSLYLRRFVRDDTIAAIGAILYTFSGFTLINNNYFFFLDVIAVFPLVMLGVELIGERFDRRSFLTLTLAVFLHALVNYYFLVSSCLLVVIYLIFRFDLLRHPLRQCKLLLQLGGSAVLGACMAGFVLLPSFRRILHTPKATGTLGSLYLRPYSLNNLLERIRIFFMPIENNIQHAFYASGSWTSTAVYLSVFGAAFVLLFAVRNRRHWLTQTIAALLVVLLIPILNSAFSLFTDAFYTRWLYGLVLLLDLATVLVLQHRNAIRQTQLKHWFRIAILVTLVLSVPPAAVCTLEYFGISTPLSRIYSVGQSTIFAGMKGIALAFILTAVNYALLAVIIYRPRIRIQSVLALTCVGCVCNSVGYLCFYNYINADRLSGMQTELAAFTPSDATEYTFRTDSSADNQNLSLFLNTPSVSGYHSLQNENSVRFAVAAGYAEDSTAIVLSRPEQDSGALDTLLSVRYYTDLGNDPDAAVPEGFSLLSDEDGIRTYTNDNYLPFGFCYDGYITEETAESSSLSKAQLMLCGLVADEQTAETLSEIMPELELPQTFDLSDEADKRRAQSTSSFSGTSTGFTANITLKTANYVFFSVPNDVGWTATVNGKEADILTVNYGLCAVRCNRGINQIMFTYHTPWLTVGCAMSLIAALMMTFLALLLPARTVKQ